MVNKALIIADVLNDFMPGGALPVSEGDAVVAPINKIIHWCENKEDWIIILACDWHSEDSKHFEKYPVHCVRNTPGAEFHPDLKISPNAIMIYKGLDPNEDGYSAFGGIALSCFGLDEILHIFSIEEVFICGLATDYCVKFSAIDSVKRGFKTFVLLDGCRTLTKESGRKAIKEMGDAGVVMTATWEVMELKA